MAKQVLTNTKLWLAGYDLSADVAGLSLVAGTDAVDVTNFGSGGARERLPGLDTIDLQYNGLWEAGAAGLPDDLLTTELGVRDAVVTLAPQTGAAGEIAYTFRALHAAYTPGPLQMGDAIKFSAHAVASTGPLVRGTIVHNATRTAGGTGSSYQLGAVPAGKALYAALHVVAISGLTVTVLIDSDDNAGFTSPTLAQIGLPGLSAIGAAWGSVGSAGADTWYRARWTVTGTGSATFVVVVGIA